MAKPANDRTPACRDFALMDPEWLTPASVNGRIYRPVDADDPDVVQLAEDIRVTRSVVPLEVTGDLVILSGHRRHAACKLAGVSLVPVLIQPFDSSDPRFLDFLVRFNRQRSKTPAEEVREQVVLARPGEAEEAVEEERVLMSEVRSVAFELGECQRRARISAGKMPMLEAAIAALDSVRDFWPVTNRKVHYLLAEIYKPLRHASKPNSTYRLDDNCYDDLCDLLIRARIEGRIDPDALGDDTRPVETWNVHSGVGPYVQRQFERFLATYHRDLLQDQPNHIELFAEKMTLESVVSPVCARFTLPYIIGRGFASYPPRRALVKRFRKTGKDRLVVLLLVDHDVDGFKIARSFGRSIRDDFGVEAVHAVHVGLRMDQIRALSLPAGGKAKGKQRDRDDYVRAHGTTDTFELDAVDPLILQEWLTEAVEQELDADAFNRQLDREQEDKKAVAALRAEALERLRDVMVGRHE